MSTWWERGVRDAHADAGEVDVAECSMLIGEPVRYALRAIRGDRAAHSRGMSGVITSIWGFVISLRRMAWWYSDRDEFAVPRVERILAVTHDSVVELALDEGRHPIVVTARYVRPTMRVVRRDPHWYRLDIAKQRFWVRRDLGTRLRSYASTWPAQ